MPYARLTAQKKKMLGAEDGPDDYTQRVADWGRGGSLQSAVDTFEGRLGPAMKASGDRNDRANIARRLKW